MISRCSRSCWTLVCISVWFSAGCGQHDEKIALLQQENAKLQDEAAKLELVQEGLHTQLEQRRAELTQAGQERSAV